LSEVNKAQKGLLSLLQWFYSCYITHGLHVEKESTSWMHCCGW